MKTDVILFLGQSNMQRREYRNPYIGGHFSAAGLEVLGRTAGSALARLVNAQN
ncbi:MAG: hypothetical protein IJK33_10050 [Clostridia bacterium]|nr:hypothetical protein [Clostridia bacterium]